MKTHDVTVQMLLSSTVTPAVKEYKLNILLITVSNLNVFRTWTFFSDTSVPSSFLPFVDSDEPS